MVRTAKKVFSDSRMERGGRIDTFCPECACVGKELEDNWEYQGRSQGKDAEPEQIVVDTAIAP
jgi:hypothetical protein